MKKKFVCLLAAMVLMVVMASTALAAGSATYENGVLTWSVSGDGYIEVYLNGSIIDAGTGSVSGHRTIDIGGATHLTVSGENGSLPNVPINVKDEPKETPTPDPTEEPTPTPVITEEPTPTPVITEEPTKVPTTDEPTKVPSTNEPTKAPTAKPTKAPSNNSDVPKTGDATTTFMFVIVAAMVLAAGALTAMRVVSRKK